jgi:hypothetical protein
MIFLQSTNKIRALVLTLAVSLLSMMASAQLPQIDGKRIGKAKLTVWGFNIYNASLYSESGEYQPSTNIDDKLTLVIDYKVNIDQRKLLEQTDKLWKALNISASKRRIWIEQLSLVWTSIKKKDRLVFFASTQCFQHNGNDIGCIDDPEFSEAFLDIWLSKKTEYPKQRLQLIGAKS